MCTKCTQGYDFQHCCVQAHRPLQRVHCRMADSLHASSNGVSAAPPARPVLESHAWDATYMRAPTEQPYRGTKFPAVPNRLRIFAGTSNPVSLPTPLGIKMSLLPVRHVMRHRDWYAQHRATIQQQANLKAMGAASASGLDHRNHGTQALAQEVACYLGMDLGGIKIKRFADGEIYVQVQVSVLHETKLAPSTGMLSDVCKSVVSHRPSLHAQSQVSKFIRAVTALCWSLKNLPLAGAGVHSGL